MIIDKVIQIKTNAKNRQHYLDKGYELSDKPEYIDVHSHDLHPSCKVRVDCKCVDCGLVRESQFAQYRERCAKCSQKIAHEAFKKERNSCKHCGEKVKDKNATSCWSCHTNPELAPRGEASACYKGGKPNCSGCGKELSNWNSMTEYKNTQCLECYNKERADNSNPMNNKTNLMKRFSLKVRCRDNYTCALCGSHENTHAHHLDGFDNNPDLREDVDNGITLCECCHVSFHKIYGYGNNTTEQFNEFKESCK